jgi:hypothetical protein
MRDAAVAQIERRQDRDFGRHEGITRANPVFGEGLVKTMELAEFAQATTAFSINRRESGFSVKTVLNSNWRMCGKFYGPYSPIITVAEPPLKSVGNVVRPF